MAGVSLFQKWRSQNFEDLVGQEIVVQTLRNALTLGKPASAYLFCGPRGTGKTSTARILAKALNCVNGPTPTPCGVCPACKSIASGSCLDVLEIDAASHTQVDKIREFIIDKVQFAPAQVRYKVYIIDEVHKLSAASFNALLKTLEEPPSHVVFILATTDPQELLPTILSRCQRYDFQRFTVRQTMDRIKYIAEQEKVEIDDLGAELIARSSEGSMRDALVGLEQAVTFCGPKISGEAIRGLLGLAGLEAVSDLVSSFITQDSAKALSILDDLVKKGRDLNKLTGELLEYLRLIMLVCVGAADAEFLGVSDAYYQELVQKANIVKINTVNGWIKKILDLQRRIGKDGFQRLNWELTLIELTVQMAQDSSTGLNARVAALEAQTTRLTALLERQEGAISPTFTNNHAVSKSAMESSDAQPTSFQPVQFEEEPKRRHISELSTAPHSPAAQTIQQPSEPPAPAVTPTEDLGWDEPSTPSTFPKKKLQQPAQSRPMPGQLPVLEPDQSVSQPAGKSHTGTLPLNVSSVLPLASENIQGELIAGSTGPTKQPPKSSKTAEKWRKLLDYTLANAPDLYPLLEQTTCLSMLKGTIKIKYAYSQQEQYMAAVSQHKDLEATLSTAMQRPIRLALNLEANTDKDPQEEYSHTVNLLINSFGGRVISTYNSQGR